MAAVQVDEGKALPPLSPVQLVGETGAIILWRISLSANRHPLRRDMR
jgi:hypothetical protein